MSKYTTEVRFICETACGYTESQGYSKVDEIVTQSAPKIFDFDFPIFDENYRLVLERKILKHYYTQEIGEETVGLWKLRLNTTLNEIMPYYNKLYETELLEFNPLYDVDYRKEGNRKGNQTDEGTTDANRQNVPKNSQWTLYNDTPQGTVQDIIGAESSNGYLTSATHVINDATGSNDTEHTARDGEINTTEDYAEHVFGKYPGKTYAQMITEFRETFLNIDMLIIDELKNLFMGLW